ncbi:MAG: hypothetical protein U9Q69_03855 [Nanoarchaeota archaeon]|nr:hypothetical protein [Nanoarchaeota archaeon]
MTLLVASISITDKIFIIIDLVLNRTLEIIKAPLSQPNMLWILGPMVLAMFLMSFYFGRYKSEELGWNTAFGNSLILIFISVDLLRFLYNQGLLFQFSVHNALVAAIILEGFLLTFFNFFHLMPKSFAFGLSSGQTVNVIMLFVIVLIYSQLPLNYITAISCALLAIILLLSIKIIQIIQPTFIEEGE